MLSTEEHDRHRYLLTRRRQYNPTEEILVPTAGDSNNRAGRQGRLCGLTVTELMAEARGKTPQEIGYYRLRAPVKPIMLSELAGLPKGEGATKAVVRR